MQVLKVGLVQKLAVETVAKLFVLIAGDKEHVVGIFYDNGVFDSDSDL